MACVCGHSEEEHGNDPEYPGSTACDAELRLAYISKKGQSPVEKCDCIAFEEEEENEDA